MKINLVSQLVVAFYLTLVSATICVAQKGRKSYNQKSFDISTKSIFYPHRFKPGTFQKEIALSQIKLPFDWLESSVQVPLLQFHANYAITKSITVDGRISSLYVANQITMGPRWHQQFNNFSFNIGYDIAFAFGSLKVEGFDSSVTTWINYPNISIGYKLNELAFTLKGELNVITSNESRQGEIVISKDKNLFNGLSIGLYMEQRLWKDHVCVLGVKNTVAKYHFMAWPAFSTFNRFYSIPEFYFGLVL